MCKEEGIGEKSIQEKRGGVEKKKLHLDRGGAVLISFSAQLPRPVGRPRADADDGVGGCALLHSDCKCGRASAEENEGGKKKASHPCMQGRAVLESRCAVSPAPSGCVFHSCWCAASAAVRRRTKGAQTRPRRQRQTTAHLPLPNHFEPTGKGRVGWRGSLATGGQAADRGGRWQLWKVVVAVVVAASSRPLGDTQNVHTRHS